MPTSAASSPVSVLLAPKLYIPPPRAHCVRRTRLIARLDDSLSRRLTLISAPAGFGKTTLVADWIAHADIHAVWVSVDEDDNDLARFFAYVIAALQKIEPRIGKAALPLIQSQPGQPSTVQAALTLLLNDLAPLPTPSALILDDYHLIHFQPIHNALSFLLEHLPPQMHLLVLTRADPPLSLARLRVRDQLVELRAAELRFTQEETANFLNDVMHLDVTADQIAALDARTEGWIAGLQLAALSMRDRKDLDGFIASFAGSHRLVLHYLIEEVLQRQPEPVQRFLLETSVLDRMTAPLCNALTQRTDASAMLEHLEQENLFLLPLDDEGSWYRFHHLFADTLRARLEQAHPERVPELHRRASEWFEQQNYAEDAVRHALEGRDYSRATRLIEGLQRVMYAHNAVPTLARWILSLPRAVLQSHLRLAMSGVWACLALSQAKQAAELLEVVETALGFEADILMTDEADSLSPNVRGALVEVMIARCTLAMAPSLLQFRENVVRLQRVIPYLTDDAPYLHNPPANLRPVALFNLGIAHQIGGDSSAASDAFAQALMLARERNNSFIVLMSITHLAQLQMVQGQLHRAADTFREALNASSAFPSPIAGLAHLGLGAVLYERNELERAEDELRQAIELAKVWSNWETLLPAHAALARLKVARGDSAGAVAAMNDVVSLAERFPGIPMQPAIAMCRAEISARCGDTETASRWADASDLYSCDPIPYSREDEALVLARVLIALKREELAQPLLERLLAGAQAGERWYHAIGLLALQAVALNALGQTPAALGVLRRALALAEPEGYVRAFLESGTAMEPMLERLAGESDYARTLRHALRQGRPMSSISTGSSSTMMAEAVSERERQVLGLIADGLSNQEIADRLVISVATVKKHIENAYGKLQVKSRTQAIARAKTLGLID